MSHSINNRDGDVRNTAEWIQVDLEISDFEAQLTAHENLQNLIWDRRRDRD